MDGTPETFLPYLVAVNLTKRCNLACAHCYMDAQQRASAEGEMSDAELKDMFAEIGARAPGTILVLTGGEPLMHPGLLGLVRAGKESGLRMVLGTNGVLLTEGLAAKLKAAGLEGMGISLDSVYPKSHDLFRGVSGAFAKSCNAVRLCRAAGMHAQIHFTVTRWNRAEIPEAVTMARNLGAAILNFFFLVCVGRGEGLMDLSAAEYEDALREIAILQKTAPGILVQTRCTPHFKRILHENDPEDPYTRATGYDGGGCLAATHYCRITPKGEMTPCPYIEESGGNVRTQGFWPVWDGNALFGSLRKPELLQGRCGACEYKQICGGCRARAFAEKGDLLAEDPNCGYVPKGAEPVQALLPGRPGVALRPEGGERSGEVDWTPEARDRLSHLPVFLRPMVKRKLEERARRENTPVTLELMRKHREERERELGIKFN
jgi:radical SAM protein with 4Fe4S-binding SPASM domain